MLIINRCDLGIALLNNSSTVFFCQPSEPVIAYPAADDKMSFQDNNELTRNMDNDLAIAWQVMKRFCLQVNLGTQTQRQVRLEIINETMAALMYRLLHMGFAAGSVDETLRHGLLAFSYHIFLQWQDIKLPYLHFPTSYQNCILASRLPMWCPLS